jgi:hypothetical protein
VLERLENVIANSIHLLNSIYPAISTDCDIGKRPALAYLLSRGLSAFFCIEYFLILLLGHIHDAWQEAVSGAAVLFPEKDQ